MHSFASILKLDKATASSLGSDGIYLAINAERICAVLTYSYAFNILTLMPCKWQCIPCWLLAGSWRADNFHDSCQGLTWRPEVPGRG